MANPKAYSFNERTIKNFSIEQKYIDSFHDAIFDKKGITKDDIIKKVDFCNAASYILSRNTTRMDDVIEDYNSNLRYLKELNLRNINKVKDTNLYVNNSMSKPFEITNIKLDKETKKKGIYYTAKSYLFNTKTNDIFTRNYKRALGLLKSKNSAEGNMIFLAREANQKSHYILKGIEDILENINFKEKEMRKGEFLSKVDFVKQKLYKDMKKRHDQDIDLPEEECRPDYHYDSLNYYLENNKTISEENMTKKDIEKFNTGKDSYDMLVKAIGDNFPKKELYKDSECKEIDDNFVKSVADSVEFKKISDYYFVLKEDAIMGLMMYQKKVIDQCQKEGIDPYESGKLTHHIDLVRTEDNLSDGRASYRIAAYTHDAYKKYLEFNPSIARSKKYRQELGDASRTYDDTEVGNEIRDIATKQKRRFLDEYECTALIDESEFEAFHLPQNELLKHMMEKDIKHVSITNNSLIEQLAYKVTYIKSPYHNREDYEKLDEQILQRVRKENEIGKEKVKGDVEKFEKEYNVRDQVIEELKEKEGNVI